MPYKEATLYVFCLKKTLTYNNPSSTANKHSVQLTSTQAMRHKQKLSKNCVRETLRTHDGDPLDRDRRSGCEDGYRPTLSAEASIFVFHLSWFSGYLDVRSVFFVFSSVLFFRVFFVFYKKTGISFFFRFFRFLHFSFFSPFIRFLHKT